MSKRTNNRNWGNAKGIIRIPSKELTCSLQKHFWRWFPVSQEGHVSFLEGTSFLFVYCDGLNWQCAHHCTGPWCWLRHTWILGLRNSSRLWWWVGNVEAGAYQGNLSICLQYPWIIAWGGIWSRIEILTGTSLHPKWPMNFMTHYPPGTSTVFRIPSDSPRSLAFIKGIPSKMSKFGHLMVFQKLTATSWGTGTKHPTKSVGIVVHARWWLLDYHSLLHQITTASPIEVECLCGSRGCGKPFCMASRCRGKWMRQGWIWLDDMEMLEARVAGANFQMFDVSFLW